MGWAFSSDKPIYLQIADRIQSRIISGEYAAGERIASVRELACEAGTNPNTVQKALICLEGQGLVSAISTAGRFVTSDVGVIAKSRTAMSRQIADNALSQFAALGLTAKEAVEILKERVESTK